MSIPSAARTISLRIRQDTASGIAARSMPSRPRLRLRQATSSSLLLCFRRGLWLANDSNCRLLVLRHDVDVRDVAGNEAFVAVERAVGARSSFCSRRSTAGEHARLVRRPLDVGFEVGYRWNPQPQSVAAHGD